MADYFDGKKFGSILAFGPYTRDNITASQSNVDLTYAQANYVIMPADGRVVGISIYANAAATAGTCTVRAHKASTEMAASGYPAPVLNATTSQVSYATVRPGAVTFSAGDKLGLSIVTDATWSPATLELDGWLFVQLDPS